MKDVHIWSYMSYVYRPSTEYTVYATVYVRAGLVEGFGLTIKHPPIVAQEWIKLGWMLLL